MKSVGTGYEVCVIEWASNGARGAPQETAFTGRNARERALAFAKAEQCAATISISIRHFGKNVVSSTVYLPVERGAGATDRGPE